MLKLKLKLNQALLTLILVLPGLSAQAEPWNPRDPLKYPSSLHSIAMMDGYTTVGESLAGACLDAVRDHLKAGGNFYSKTVVQNSLPFEQFPRVDVADNSFFHWTKSHKALFDIAKNKTYEDLFSYPRDRNENYSGWTFYIAADPTSSMSYGRHSYKFTLRKGERVYFSQGDKPGSAMSPDVLLGNIFTELRDRNTQLQKCEGRMEALELLALEASNVSLVAYFGIDNHISLTDRGVQWFKLVNPWAIKSMEFYKEH